MPKCPMSELGTRSLKILSESYDILVNAAHKLEQTELVPESQKRRALAASGESRPRDRQPFGQLGARNLPAAVLQLRLGAMRAQPGRPKLPNPAQPVGFAAAGPAFAKPKRTAAQRGIKQLTKVVVCYIIIKEKSHPPRRLALSF